MPEHGENPWWSRRCDRGQSLHGLAASHLQILICWEGLQGLDDPRARRPAEVHAEDVGS